MEEEADGQDERAEAGHFLDRLSVAQLTARDEAEEHSAEGGDETESDVAAAVFEEGLGAGEEIEEPAVEGGAEVFGLGPLAGMLGPGGPIGEEQGGDEDPEGAGGETACEDKEEVAKADLGEGVFEGEVGLGAVCRAQEDAEGDQDEGAPGGVAEGGGPGGAEGFALGQGERESDADQEGEGRLDEVMERAADPGDVGLVEGEEIENRVARIGAGEGGEAQDFGHHEEHDEAAVGVDGEVALQAECY